MRILSLMFVGAMVACSGSNPAPPDSGSGGSGSATGSTCNSMGICKPVAPADCMLGSQGSGAACDGSVYDFCDSGSDCQSGMCHLFQASGFQVCTTTCSPGDDSSCPAS